MLDINPIIKIGHSFELNCKGCITGSYDQGLLGFCSLCVKICFPYSESFFCQIILKLGMIEVHN